MRYLEQGQSVRSERDGHLSPGEQAFHHKRGDGGWAGNDKLERSKGADSYDLYYAPGYTIDKTTALEMVGMTSPATVVDLTDGMPYAFAVSAVDTTGVESRLSNGADGDASALPVTLSIAAQPQSQSVVAGKSVTFSVMVTGTPPLRYQWYKDSTLIPERLHRAIYLRTHDRPMRENIPYRYRMITYL